MNAARRRRFPSHGRSHSGRGHGYGLLAKQDLPRLVAGLLARYDVVAPIYDGAALVLGKIGSPDDVASGYRDEQRPGHYRIEKAEDGSYFTFGNPADSPKKFLHPAQLDLFSGYRHLDGTFSIDAPDYASRKLAFFGIRPCDAFAVHVLDKTFLLNPNVDRSYQRRRDGLFLAVLNCTSPCSTCFCASMGTGPRVKAGYDLSITELGAGFLVEAGSPAGVAMLATLPMQAPTAIDAAEADRLLAAAVARMGRKLNTHNLPQILRESLEHPHWDYMKTWCIGCTNCTMVCPTCFCNNTLDYVDVSLRYVARRRVWDSCFTLQFAEVHGGNSRPDLKHRYRHWVTHKLSYWVEQYGVSGCVGCGRCLTWCPVGIDITEVAAVVRGERR